MIGIVPHPVGPIEIMIEINKNVILVPGAKNAAIYDLNTNKVYSIDRSAFDIILKFATEREAPLSPTGTAYIAQLVHANLLSDAFTPRKFDAFSRDEAALSFAWLELTEGCNLRCLHCYEGNGHSRSFDELSAEDWKRVIADLAANGCKRVQVTGGECSLRKDLADLIAYASDIGITDITVFTNASLLSDPLIGFFADRHVKVRVSLYGHTAAIHDSITQVSGSFDKTVGNIKKMVSAGIHVTPAVVIMRQNQNSVEDIKQFIIGLGLKYEGYDVIREVFEGTQSRYTPTDRKIIDSKKRRAPSFSITEEQFRKALSHNTCWYGKFAITPTGKVIPCIFERKIILGDVTEQSISDILRSEPLRRHWNLDFSRIETCKDCEFRFACKDCRPLAMAKCHDVKAKNPRCLYDPYEGTWGSDLG